MDGMALGVLAHVVSAAVVLAAVAVAGWWFRPDTGSLVVWPGLLARVAVELLLLVLYQHWVVPHRLGDALGLAWGIRWGLLWPREAARQSQAARRGRRVRLQGLKAEREGARVFDATVVPGSGMWDDLPNDLVFPAGWRAEVKERAGQFGLLYRWTARDGVVRWTEPDGVVYVAMTQLVYRSGFRPARIHGPGGLARSAPGSRRKTPTCWCAGGLTSLGWSSWTPPTGRGGARATRRPYPRPKGARTMAASRATSARSVSEPAVFVITVPWTPGVLKNGRWRRSKTGIYLHPDAAAWHDLATLTSH